MESSSVWSYIEGFDSLVSQPIIFGIKSSPYRRSTCPPQAMALALTSITQRNQSAAMGPDGRNKASKLDWRSKLGADARKKESKLV